METSATAPRNTTRAEGAEPLSTARPVAANGIPPLARVITVVIPTRNEQDNIGPLLARLDRCLEGLDAEILIVDDSSDATPSRVWEAATDCSVDVRLEHRPVGRRPGGLGGAVVQGLRLARGEWVVVMDGDLQHPPELVTELVGVGQSRRVDLVVATRHLGGSADGLDGGARHAASSSAAAIARAVFPRRLSRLSDPMSGFFAVRRAALDPDRLRPNGFKILMEIVARQPGLHVAEVPFAFGERRSGASKAGVSEGLRFLSLLMTLRVAVLHQQVRRSQAVSLTQRIQRLLAFGLVGASGLVVNTAVLWLVTRQQASPHYLIGAIIATEASTTWNFALTERLVFRGPKPGTVLSRGIRFYLLNHLALLPRLPLLALLVEWGSLPLLAANLVTLVLLFLVRFVIADSAIYAQAEVQSEPQPVRIVVDVAQHGPDVRLSQVLRRPGRRYLPHRYAIDGVATIGSQVPLPELEYFRAQWLDKDDVDIAIRVGPVGASPRGRARMTQYTSPPALSYEEHLGRLGANFRVDIDGQINVVASRALAHSPHVLYTNVIEALLRFVTVSRGKILLHSACLELDGHGLLLSARTDTGKTGTVLRLLRERGGLFLSDDMTILDADGTASCFPKPLTISHHTLRAVEAGDLTPAEWRRLRLQSRLHSKEGRQWGMLLARLNVPIMGINSLTQRVVPPPKYAVDRLVDCAVTRTTTVEDLFVIERGPTGLADLAFDDTIETLVENTDDAYGFPPFAQMAPSIVIGDDAYDQLRAKERETLVRAMRGIRARRLVTPDFTWADRIPGLLGPTRPAAV